MTICTYQIAFGNFCDNMVQFSLPELTNTKHFYASYVIKIHTFGWKTISTI